MSIFTELKKTCRGLSFHTPGHKGALSRLDGTEIEGVFPEHAIETAQQKAAAHYGAKAVRFLVNGSSIGVKSMIMSVGGNIIAPENRHISVDEGACLAGISVEYVKNRTQHGLPMPLTARQIEQAYSKDKGIRAALVVSPDYFGFTADLKEIRKTCDELGIYMLVDSAHGAHFASADEGKNALFPQSASRIADACNMSAHKTMRAYTQSAYLAVNSEILLPEVDKNLALLGTTSPSYIMMGQLERAIEYEEKYASRYAELCKEIKRISGKGFTVIENDDPMRITVDFAPSGLSGEEACRRLMDGGVYAEKFEGSKAVFIVTLSDKPSNVKRLCRELRRI